MKPRNLRGLIANPAQPVQGLDTGSTPIIGMHAQTPTVQGDNSTDLVLRGVERYNPSIASLPEAWAHLTKKNRKISVANDDTAAVSAELQTYCDSIFDAFKTLPHNASPWQQQQWESFKIEIAGEKITVEDLAAKSWVIAHEIVQLHERGTVMAALSRHDDIGHGSNNDNNMLCSQRMQTVINELKRSKNICMGVARSHSQLLRFVAAPHAVSALKNRQRESNQKQTERKRNSKADPEQAAMQSFMDQFDSATPDGCRKRNQKKAPSVVKQLKATSEAVEAIECVFDAQGELRRERPLTGNPNTDDGMSPLEGESKPEPDYLPPKKKKVGRRPRPALVEYMAVAQNVAPGSVVLAPPTPSPFAVPGYGVPVAPTLEARYPQLPYHQMPAQAPMHNYLGNDGLTNIDSAYSRNPNIANQGNPSFSHPQTNTFYGTDQMDSFADVNNGGTFPLINQGGAYSTFNGDVAFSNVKLERRSV